MIAHSLDPNENQAGLNYILARSLFYFATLFFVLDKDFSAWQSAPDLLWEGTGVFAIFKDKPHYLPLGFLQMVWKLSLVFSALPLEWPSIRWSRWVSFAGALFLWSYEKSFGFVTHQEIMPLFILAFLSLDYRNVRWRNLNNAQLQIFFIRMLVCLFYFGAGLSKLRESGLAWFSPSNISNYILHNHMSYFAVRDNIFYYDFGLYILDFQSILMPAVIGFVLAELLSPICLVARGWLRWTILTTLFAGHIGIYLILLVDFKHYLVFFLFWIPFHKLRRKEFQFFPVEGLRKKRAS